MIHTYAYEAILFIKQLKTTLKQ